MSSSSTAVNNKKASGQPHYDPLSIFSGLPKLVCGVCTKEIEASRNVCILECGYHVGCSISCSTRPCIHCKCDRCNQFMQCDMVAIKCGCRYHSKCVPLDFLFVWGCYLCRPVNKAADEIEGENLEETKRRALIKNDFFFEDKMIRRGWKYSKLVEMKHYRGRVIAGKIPYDRWKNYDLDIGSFKNLEVDVYDMFADYFMDLSKTEFMAIVKLYPQVNFVPLIETCIENLKTNGYTATEEEWLKHLKEQKKLTNAEMSDLVSVTKGSLKTMRKEFWDMYYPDVYAKLQQLTIKGDKK